MSLRSWLQGLFAERTDAQLQLQLAAFDRALSAKDDAIKALTDEVHYLRHERAEIQILLNRAVRLEVTPRVPIINTGEAKETTSRNWSQLKNKLEMAHRKPSSSEMSQEDRTAHYWREKNKEMEAQINANEESQAV